MKIKIYKNKSGRDALTRDLRLARSLESVRMQFGNEIVEITDDSIANDSREQAVPQEHVENFDIEEQVHEQYDSSKVHLVLQKGRLFNMEYPEIPVLYDRGRFQLVAIEPDEAKNLFNSDVCFSVRSLKNQGVVFHQHSSIQRLPQISASEQDLVESVDANQFIAMLELLVGFQNRHSLSNNYLEVVDILREVLNNLGYATHIEPIDIFDRVNQFVGKSANLIAQKFGQNHPDARLILVTAHLDSVNLRNQLDNSLIAPGADDNGSGSAGVMEMARVFSQLSGQHEIKFVLFGGEEQNLFGSSQYVENMAPEEKARLVAVINMDMIGVRNSTPSTVLIEGASVSRNVMDALALRAAVHTDLLVRTSENPFASDHVPFINEGLPAVLTIEGDDSQNSVIHTPDDVLSLINADYAEKILKMNVGYIASLMVDDI